MRSPWFRMVVGLVLVALLATGLAQLRFDASYRAYFDADDPLLAAFDGVRDRFDPNDQLIIVVTAQDHASIYSPAGLQLIRTLSDRALLLPHAKRVDSLSTYPRIVADPEGFRSESLLPAGPVDTAAAAAVRAKVRGDRLIEGVLVDRDGRAALVVVTMTPPAAGPRPTLLAGGGDALSEWAVAMRAANALLATHGREGFELGLSGIVAMNHAFADATLHDTVYLLPFAFVALFVVVALALRSALAALHVFVLGCATQVAALGVLGWSGVPLTSTVAMAPLMLLTITVADGVHVLLPLRGQLQARHGDVDGAIATVFAEQRGAIFLATLTTIVGFLTMNFSAVPTYRVLGNVVAVGAAVAGLLTVYWLPAVVRLLPPRWAPVPDAASIAPVPRALAGVSNSVARLGPRAHLLPWAIVLLLGVVTVVGVSRLRLDDAFVSYFAPSMPFRAAADAQTRFFGGLYEIEFALDSGRAGGVHDPRYLRAVEDFARFLERQPEVRHVQSWTRVLERIHTRVAESDALAQGSQAVNRSTAGDSAGLPRDAPTAAQYLLLYQFSLPVGQDANAWVDVDQSASRLVVALDDMRSSQMRDFEARALAWWRERNAAGAGVDVGHGAVNLVFSHLGGRNVEAMLWANIWGVLVIAGLIALFLRSLTIGLLSVFMNLVPLALAFAIWGFTVRDVGLSLSVAAGMTLGILDHNAVHLLGAFIRARRAQTVAFGSADVLGAIAHALREVAPGILVTNAALCVGFFVLARSSFALNADLGALTALTLVLALVVNLGLLPLWVLLRAGVRPPQIADTTAAADGGAH